MPPLNITAKGADNLAGILPINAQPALMVPLSGQTGDRDAEVYSYLGPFGRVSGGLTAHAGAFPLIWTHVSQRFVRTRGNVVSLRRRPSCMRQLLCEDRRWG
jgi:hypothetical protein